MKKRGSSYWKRIILAAAWTMMAAGTAFAEEPLAAEAGNAAAESGYIQEEGSVVIEAGAADDPASEEASGQKASGQKVSGQEASEREISGQEISGQEISEQQILEQEVPMECAGAENGEILAAEENGESSEINTEEVLLDVPQVYALDERWKSKRFDPNAKDTIGKTGCTLCCLTAVISFIDDTLYRPDELCKKMSFSNGCMAWYGEIDSRFKTSQSYSLDTIREKIQNQEPVIVKSYQKAKNKKGQWYNKSHFVVVTGYRNHGKTEEDFLIMDPGKRDTDGRTLKSHFSTHPNNKQLYYLK